MTGRVSWYWCMHTPAADITARRCRRLISALALELLRKSGAFRDGRTDIQTDSECKKIAFDSGFL
jgi:hypothetical protein